MALLGSTVTELGERGIGVRSLHEQLDATTASGRLAFHVFGALAEFEAQLTPERTQAGLAAASNRGRPAGRPSVMTDERREMARQMLNSGYEVAKVARTIGVSRATIYRHVD